MKTILLTSMISLFLNSAYAGVSIPSSEFEFPKSIALPTGMSKYFSPNQGVGLPALRVGDKYIQCSSEAGTPKKDYLAFEDSVAIKRLRFQKEQDGHTTFSMFNEKNEYVSQLVCRTLGSKNGKFTSRQPVSINEVSDYLKLSEHKPSSEGAVGQVTSAIAKLLHMGSPVHDDKNLAKSDAILTSDTIKKLELKELPESKYGIYISVNEEFIRTEEFTKFIKANDKAKSNR